MPRKKQNLKRVRKEMTEEREETPEIKMEPADDYGESLENTDFVPMEIKSEPIDFEYLSNNFNGSLSQNDKEITDSSVAGSSINQNENSDQGSGENDENTDGSIATRRSERQPQTNHWYDQYEKFSIDELITMFGRNDRPYKNMTISEEEYLKYTGKQLEYPITKKMYEHFRYMKTKILYKDKFKCDLCTRTFPFRHELARHRLYHTGIKKHVCEVCGKTFILKGQLTTHMLSHTRIRRFKCKYCPASFLLGSHLRQHLPSHNPALRLQCELCNLTFTRKASLDRHVRRIHIEKEQEGRTKRRNINFTNCRFCNRLLRTKDVDKCLCRSKIRRDYCPYCDTRLGNAKNLSIHMETFHPDEINPLLKPASEADIEAANKSQEEKDENYADKVPPPEVTKKLLQDKILGRSGVNKRKPAWTTQIKPKPPPEAAVNSIPVGTLKTTPVLSPIFNTTLVPVQVLLNQGSTPVFKGSTPVLQGSTPILQGPTSVLQGSTPVIQGSTSILQGPTSVLQGSTPVIQRSTPILQGPTSVLQGSTPVIQGTAPVLQGSIQGLPQLQNQNNIILAPTVGMDGKTLLTVPGLKTIQVNSQLGHKNSTVLTSSTGLEGNPSLALPLKNKIQILPKLPIKSSAREVRVGSSNGRYDIMCIEPRESEVKRKEEMDRVVTFKVETKEDDQEENAYGQMVADIKVEPEDGEEPDRFVVYKVTEDETSIRDGFYKALCIKQEIKEEPPDDGYYGNTATSQQTEENHENHLSNGHDHEISHGSYENGIMGNESGETDSPEAIHEMESVSQTENGYEYILDCDEIADTSDFSPTNSELSQDSKLSQDSNSNMATFSSSDAIIKSDAIETTTDMDIQSAVSKSNYTTIKSMLKSQTVTSR